MTVSEGKGAGITVIDGWLVIDTRAIGYIFEISIVERKRILIQKNKTICRAKSGPVFRVFVKRLIGRVITKAGHLILSCVRPGIHVGGT